MWLGVAALAWTLGAWLPFAAMGDAVADLAVEAVARAALFVALGVGAVAARWSPVGYLIVAAVAAASAAGHALAALGGAPVGMMSAIGLAVAILTAVAALARWWEVRRGNASGGPAGFTPGPSFEPATRSPAETAVAAGLAVGGLLVLGRAAIETLQGLAELPGASEHWAGDVVAWLVFVLPIPILAGVTMLAVARWLWTRHPGTRWAAAVGIAAAGIAVAWIAIDAAWFLGQGSYWGSLDDPLLWAPLSLLAGTAVWVIVLVGSSLRQGRHVE
jgi:hypothetical protein